MAKLTAEMAQAEVEKWLDWKKILKDHRENHKDSIETIQSAMEEGVLILNPDTMEFTQTLFFPIGENQEISELKFRARMTDKDQHPYMKGVSATDGDERLVAIMAALTKQPKGIIKSLDSSDRRITRSIASFFI